MSTIIPASISAIFAGLKFWDDKKAKEKEQTDAMYKAIDNVMKAAICTKAYLYNLKELALEMDRDKEQEIAIAWQIAADSIYQFDRALYESAKVKALGWADPREWLKAEKRGITIELDKLINQCDWLKSKKT
jgi:hypothetical protein